MELMSQLSQTEGAREARARRAARKQGYCVEKVTNWNNVLGLDGFVVVDERMNAVVGGSHYPLSLDELESWLAEEAA